MYNENVAVGDLNGDGLKELIGPTDTHYITALDRNGGQLAGQPDLRRGEGLEPGRRARRPRGRPARLRQLRHRAPAQLRQQRARDRRPGRRRQPRRSWSSGDVYNCGIATPTATCTTCRSSSSATARAGPASGLRLDRDPEPRPGQRPALGGLQRHRERGAERGPRRPRRRRPPRDPLSLLRRQAARLLARQDRARQLALRRPRRRAFRFASEPAGGRPRRRRPGRGDLHLVAPEGRRAGRPAPRARLPGATRSTRSTCRPPSPPAAGTGGSARRPSPTSTRDPDLELVVGTAHSGVVAYDLPGTAGARVLWGTGRGSYRRTALAPPLPPPAHPAPARVAPLLRRGHAGDAHAPATSTGTGGPTSSPSPARTPWRWGTSTSRSRTARSSWTRAGRRAARTSGTTGSRSTPRSRW